MRLNIYFAAACAASGLLFSSGARSQPDGGGPSRGGLDGGRALYVANCLDCHGAAGRGDGRMAVVLRSQPTDLGDPRELPDGDEALFQSITRGRRPMPRFDELLSDEQRRQIVRYVRGLSPAPDTVARGR